MTDETTECPECRRGTLEYTDGNNDEPVMGLAVGCEGERYECTACDYWEAVTPEPIEVYNSTGYTQEAINHALGRS